MKMQRLFQAIAAISLLALLGNPANAALTVEIVGGAAQQIPIAVVPFGQTAATKTDNPADIIAADLQRTVPHAGNSRSG